MRPFFLLVVTVTLGLGAVACGDDRPPIAPTPLTTSSSLQITSLEIGGPDSVPPGEAVQLTATATLSDGSKRDVTAETTWESFHGHMMSISPSGLVTAALQKGEGEIIAKFDKLPKATPGAGWRNRKQYVLPAGTYLLYGFVKDESAYLDGARVELISGSAAGQSVIANGFFRFYGVSGDMEIRVSRTGYQTQTRATSVTKHATEPFELVLVNPRPQIAGTYLMTVTAASECRANLPAALRERTYTATVIQDGVRATFTLSGARFSGVPGGLGPVSGFTAFVEPDRIRFFLFPYDSDEPGVLSPPAILEEVGAPSYLTIHGNASLTPTASGYAGSLEGKFETVKITSPWQYEFTAFCGPARHQIVLRR